MKPIFRTIVCCFLIVFLLLPAFSVTAAALVGNPLPMVKRSDASDDPEYQQALAEWQAKKDAYDAYLQAKKKYDDEVAAYQALKAQWDAYNKYQVDLKTYNEQNVPYLAYAATMEEVNYCLSILEIAFAHTNDEHKWCFYNSLMGGTVDRVLNRRNELKKAGYTQKFVDALETSTLKCREWFAAYNEMRAINYASEFARTRALFNKYREIYSNLTKDLDVLYQCLYVVYGDPNIAVGTSVTNKINLSPEEIEAAQSSVSHFRQFLAQMYVLQALLDDEETMDPKWETPMGDVETVIDLLEEGLRPTDLNKAHPAGITFPAQEVAQPIEPTQVAEPGQQLPNEDPAQFAPPTPVADPGPKPTPNAGGDTPSGGGDTPSGGGGGGGTPSGGGGGGTPSGGTETPVEEPPVIEPPVEEPPVEEPAEPAPIVEFLEDTANVQEAVAKAIEQKSESVSLQREDTVITVKTEDLKNCTTVQWNDTFSEETNERRIQIDFLDQKGKVIETNSQIRVTIPCASTEILTAYEVVKSDSQASLSHFRETTALLATSKQLKTEELRELTVYHSITETGRLASFSVQVGKMIVCELKYQLRYESDYKYFTMLPSYAKKGETISLNVECEYGYEMKGATLVAPDGTKTEVEFSFEMPAQSLTVNLHIMPKIYHVVFLCQDEVWHEQEYAFGEVIQLPEAPSLPDQDDIKFVFRGWTPKVSETATGDELELTYRAVFSEESNLPPTQIHAEYWRFFISPIFLKLVGGFALIVAVPTVAIVLIVNRKKIFGRKDKKNDPGSEGSPKE